MDRPSRRQRSRPTRREATTGAEPTLSPASFAQGGGESYSGPPAAASTTTDVSKSWIAHILWIGLPFVVCLVYTCIRYHGFGNVSGAHFPLYTLNKVLSWTAVMYYSLCALHALLRRLLPEKWTYTVSRELPSRALILAATHVLLSLLLLATRTYYPSLVDPVDGKYTWSGELALLFGVVAFLAVGLASKLHAVPPPNPHRTAAYVMSYTGFVVALAHVVTLGARGWAQPERWPGGMPPVSLWAFAFGALALLIRFAYLRNCAA